MKNNLLMILSIHLLSACGININEQIVSTNSLSLISSNMSEINANNQYITINGTCKTNVVNLNTSSGLLLDKNCENGDWSLAPIELSETQLEVSITATDSDGNSQAINLNLYRNSLPTDEIGVLWTDKTLFKVNSYYPATDYFFNLKSYLPVTRPIIDEINGYIFWSAMGIYRSNLDGTNKILLAELDEYTNAITIDPSNETIYYALDNKNIYKINYDASNNVKVLDDPNTDGDRPITLEYDRENDRLYYFIFNLLTRADSSLHVLNSDGTSEQLLYSGGNGDPDNVNFPTSMLINNENDKFYFADAYFGIKYADLFGTNAAKLTIPFASSIIHDKTNSRILLHQDSNWPWVAGGHALIALPYDMSTSTDITSTIPDLTEPLTIGIDNNTATFYWTESSTGSLHSHKFGEGTSQELIVGEKKSPTGIAYDSRSKRVYISIENKIISMETDGSDERDEVIGLNIPQKLLIDSNHFLYWSDSGNNEIKKIQLDSNGNSISGTIVDIITGEASGPWGFDIDESANRIYWVSNNGTNDVYTKSLATLANTGADATYTMTTACRNPTDVSVDEGSYIYTICYYGDASVTRLDIDGSNQTTIAITNCDAPSGVKWDEGSQKIYWTQCGKVKKSDFDGSNSEALINTGYQQMSFIDLIRS